MDHGLDYGLDSIMDSLIDCKKKYGTVIEHFANTDESTAVQPMFYLHNVKCIPLHVVSRVSPLTRCEAG